MLWPVVWKTLFQIPHYYFPMWTWALRNFLLTWILRFHEKKRGIVGGGGLGFFRWILRIQLQVWLRTTNVKEWGSLALLPTYPSPSPPPSEGEKGESRSQGRAEAELDPGMSSPVIISERLSMPDSNHRTLTCWWISPNWLTKLGTGTPNPVPHAVLVPIITGISDDVTLFR